MDATQQKLETRLIIPGTTAVPGHPIGTYWVHSKVPRKPVFFGKHQKTGIEHAIKRASLGRPLTDAEKETMRLTDRQLENRMLKYEHEIQASLQHPNIITATELFANDGKLHLATPYAGTDLDEFYLQQAVRGIDPFREVNEHLRILYQIAQALAYCHKMGVAHLDIKPGNVAVDDDCKATVIDFGSARRLKEKADPIVELFQGITTSHAAQEQTQYAYSAKSDVFAYAILAYELLTGFPAFDKIIDDSNPEEPVMTHSIDHDKPTYDIRKISAYGTIAYLIIDALNNDPTKRPEMQRMADALERMV